MRTEAGRTVVDREETRWFLSVSEKIAALSFTEDQSGSVLADNKQRR